MRMNFFQQLIFSNNLKYRISRHFLYWFVIFSYFTLRGIQENQLYLYFKINLLYLPIDILITYILIYFIYPKLVFSKKYLQSFILFIILLIVQESLCLVVHKYIRPLFVGASTRLPLVKQVFNDIYILFIIYTSAVFIKTIKYLFNSEVKNLELKKENIENKMNLLTSQLHPHFLFNTLNNLHILSVEKSEKVSDIILKLSEVIRYILIDYNKLYSELDKELKIIQSYIEIEKLRYDNALRIDFLNELTESLEKEIQIPPLLIFTFIENAFKHGVSKSLNDPWISFHIKVNKQCLICEIKNSISENSIHATQNREKVGLKNVKDRLDLYYPQKHRLEIKKERDSFFIYLEINIEKDEN